MEHEEYMLSAQQYYELYCKTFACLDTMCSLAEDAMARAGARGDTRLIPGPWTEQIERWNFP